MLGAALVWAPLASGAYRSWPQAAAEILVLSAAALWLAGAGLAGRLEWRPSALDWPVGLLLLLVLVQAALGNRALVAWAVAAAGRDAPFPTPLLAAGSVSPAQTVESLVLFLTYATAYWLVVQMLRTRREMERLVLGLLLLGGGLAFAGLLEYLVGDTWLLGWSDRAATGRLSGTFVNADHFGAWLNMLICLGVGLLAARRRGRGEHPPLWARLRSAPLREDTIRRYLPFLAVAVMTIALVFTLSRGAILSLLVTLGALLALTLALGRVRWSLGIVAALLLTTLAYGAWIGLGPLLARLHVAEGGGRWVQAFTSLPLLRDFPVLGVGLGAYKDVYFRYQPAALDAGRVYYPYAHDDLLQLAIELGLVGAVIVAIAAWRVGHDLVHAHLLGRGACPVGGGEGEGALRSDPWSVGLGFGGLAACGVLVVHSGFDFSARIPAVGLLGAACLGIATAALHTRFMDPPRPVMPVRRASGALVRVVAALGVVVLLGAMALTIRPARVAMALDRLAPADPLPMLDAALRIDPRQPRVLLRRAIAYLDAARDANALGSAAAPDDVRAAIADLRTALRATPTDPFVHERLAAADVMAAALGVARDGEVEALAHYRRAVALGRDNAFLRRSLAAFAVTRDPLRRTIGVAEAREAIRIDPTLLADLADRFAPYGDVDWLAFVPATAADRLALARHLEQRGLGAAAGRLYASAVEAAGTEEEPLARWAQGEFLTRTGDADGALRALEPAVRRNPGNPALLAARADALARRGDPDALDAYRAAVDAADALARRHADGPLFRLASERGRSVAVALVGDRLEPPRYGRALAQYLLERKLWPQALEAWEAIEPRDAAAEFGRGLALDGLGRTDAAIEAYRKAVAQDGGNATYRLRLARRLWETEQYFQAINEWQQVVSRTPEDLEARLALARAYVKVGDRLAAFRAYQAVVRIAPDNAEARDRLQRWGALD